MAQFTANIIMSCNDLEDLIEQLQDIVKEEGNNSKKICVCIGDNTKENIEAQKEMFKNFWSSKK